MSTLTPWRPSELQRGDNAPVSQMRWDWDRMFDRILDDFWTAPAGSSPGLALDVSESAETLTIQAEVPGIDPEALDVQLVDDVLTITAEKVAEAPPEGSTRHYSERRFGKAARSLRLPCPVDAEHVEAKHKNGVVTITLRKAESVRPRRIQIQST